MSPRPGASSWWLEEGTEQCDDCLGFHHVEVVAHCAECDACLCAVCTVHVRTEGIEVLCSSCARRRRRGGGGAA